MSDTEESQGAPPHVASEFFLWLWYQSETGQGRVELGSDAGTVEYWVDDRISFRAVGEEKVSAIMTGDNPSLTPEAHAALAGGKVIRDVRLALRKEDREYSVTLKAPRIEIAGAKLPALVKSGDEGEVLYERMFLYEELHFILGGLFRAFATARCDEAWRERTLPDLRRWVAAGPASGAGLDAGEEAS
ncbi:MAG: hypothetical protein Q8P41_08880 [Pseudomonadota bacterium]|nr:hypothetical protein [Pseudomonadota bacterium]